MQTCAFLGAPFYEHIQLVARLGRGQARVNKFVATATAAVEAAESAKAEKAKRVREARQQGQSTGETVLRDVPEQKTSAEKDSALKNKQKGIIEAAPTVPVATIPRVSRSNQKAKGPTSPPSSSSPSLSPSRNPTRSFSSPPSSPKRSASRNAASNDTPTPIRNPARKTTSIKASTHASTELSKSKRLASSHRSSKSSTGISSKGGPKSFGLDKSTNHGRNDNIKKLSLGGAGLAVKMEVTPCDPLFRAAFNALAQRRSDELDYQRDLARGGDLGGGSEGGGSISDGARMPKAWWAD